MDMMMADKTKGFLDGFQKKMTRYTLLTIAVLSSVIGYTYVVDVYDSDKNLISQVWRWFVNKNYNIYTGQEGGFYIEIGKSLQSKTRNKFGLNVLNRQTVGGIENATSVASSRSSFGLVQEDSVPENDYLRNSLRYITPLYMEQMHILYRRDRFAELVDVPLDSLPDLLEITPGDSTLVKTFLENATISTGPHKSGTRIITSYLFSQIQVKTRKDLHLGLKNAIEKLIEQDSTGRGLDAVFWIAGGPLEAVKEGLGDKSDIRLMGIDPILIPKMNKTFGLKLRPASFQNVYEDGGRVATFGSYSFLIASKDVPNFAIMELLRILDNNKENIGKAQLSQFDFRAFYEQEHNGFLMDLLRNLLIFLVSATVTTSGVMVFLVWVVSSSKQVFYFRRITGVYRDYLPENTFLIQGKPPFPKPNIWDDQNGIVANLVKGTQKLILLAKNIRDDYETGGLNVTHFNHLLEHLSSIRTIFRKNLFQRFVEIIQAAKNGANAELISVEFIRHFHTAGYIGRDDYYSLVDLLKEEK